MTRCKAVAQVAGRARAEQVERVDADGADGALGGPVVADGEAVVVGFHVGIGAARQLHVLAQQARGHFHDALGVDRAARGLAHCVEQAQALLDALAFVDVGMGADPLAHLAVIAADGQRTHVHVAVLAVGPPQAVLGFEHGALCQRGRDLGPGAFAVVRVHGVEVAVSAQLGEALTRKCRPALLLGFEMALAVGRPDDCTGRGNQRTKARIDCAQFCARIARAVVRCGRGLPSWGSRGSLGHVFTSGGGLSRFRRQLATFHKSTLFLFEI